MQTKFTIKITTNDARISSAVTRICRARGYRSPADAIEALIRAADPQPEPEGTGALSVAWAALCRARGAEGLTVAEALGAGPGGELDAVLEAAGAKGGREAARTLGLQLRLRKGRDLAIVGRVRGGGAVWRAQAAGPGAPGGDDVAVGASGQG